MIILKGHRKAFVWLKCEDCGKEREVRRNTEILKKKDHPCRSCSNKRNGILKLGKPSWNANKSFEPKKVGSTYINNFGYVNVYVGKGDDNRRDKYRLQHRMIVEERLGRQLTPSERVHHIDGNKINNTPDNLYVCRDMSHHREIHNRLERIAFQLVEQGVIRFNYESGEYELQH